MNNIHQSIHTLNTGLLNVHSLRNRLHYVAEFLREFNLDMLCLTDTWLLECDADVVEAALPRTHELVQIPRPPGLGCRGEGVALVYSWALTGIRLIPFETDLTSFEVMEVVFKTSLCFKNRLNLPSRSSWYRSDLFGGS